MNDQNLREEIEKRRTFAIISHPDAGKTTLTEKLLLYGGAINLAGTVKGRKAARHAVSDWMAIEKERGISVTSSAMQFSYGGKVINILDTPGHQDFSEDTYRTLMAADSAVMVIDAGKGVEAQTIKLFKVCVMKHIPIFTFINKFDRDALDPFELLSEIEDVLSIRTTPINWPIGCGKNFKGVYDRASKSVMTFKAGQGGARELESSVYELNDPLLEDAIGVLNLEKLNEDIELIDGAADELDMEKVLRGELSPVFFGSALTNFGVEPFLHGFLSMTTSPSPRMSDIGPIDPVEEDFSAFVFKIQANMNPAHRDRIAFMRVCSGQYRAGMEVHHVRAGRKIRLTMPTQMMADKKELIEEAYAGDIIGVFDPGIFSIGDTLCISDKKFRYEGIPTFAPEHFARVRQTDTMKRKQFLKGIMQIAMEGAVQIFREPDSGMEELIVGVVGELQFEVLMYRLKAEYGVEAALTRLPYTLLRWIEGGARDPGKIVGTSDMKVVTDLGNQPLLLFVHEWSVRMVLDRNPGLLLSEFSNVERI